MDGAIKWMIGESLGSLVTAIGLVIAGFWAIGTYRSAVRKDRAEWLLRLFDLFYRDAGNKQTRIMLDHDYSISLRPILEKLLVDGDAVLSNQERESLADVDMVLNYLEFILHLESKKQLTPDDRKAMFDYWFELLKQPEYAALRLYLARFGYEAVSRQTDPTNASPNFVEHVAFYGTLQDETGKQRELGVENRLRKLSACEIEGRKIDLGEYPGLIFEDGAVPGELYEVIDSSVFDDLDRYEEFDRTNPATSLFQRRYVRLLSPNRDAWVYFYQQSGS